MIKTFCYIFSWQAQTVLLGGKYSKYRGQTRLSSHHKPEDDSYRYCSKLKAKFKPIPEVCFFLFGKNTELKSHLAYSFAFAHNFLFERDFNYLVFMSHQFKFFSFKAYSIKVLLADIGCDVLTSKLSVEMFTLYRYKQNSKDFEWLVENR